MQNLIFYAKSLILKFQILYCYKYVLSIHFQPCILISECFGGEFHNTGLFERILQLKNTAFLLIHMVTMLCLTLHVEIGLGVSKLMILTLKRKKILKHWQDLKTNWRYYLIQIDVRRYRNQESIASIYMSQQFQNVWERQE